MCGIRTEWRTTSGTHRATSHPTACGFKLTLWTAVKVRFIRVSGVTPEPNRVSLHMFMRFYCVCAGDSDALDFPAHLRPYIPNTWGSDVTIGQSLHGFLEAAAYMKVCGSRKEKSWFWR